MACIILKSRTHKYLLIAHPLSIIVMVDKFACDRAFLLVFMCHTFLRMILLVDTFVSRKGSLLGFAMGCSNTFGLVTGVFLLGFGLSEIPKSIWRNADWTTRQKVLSHKIAQMAVKLDDAHQELSNAIVVSGFFNLTFKCILHFYF